MRTATVVVLQAVIATYVASVAGVTFFLGAYAITPPGLAFALLGLLYALIPGLLALTSAYVGLRWFRGAAWLSAATCVLWGALAGFLWLLLATHQQPFPGLKTFVELSLTHAVPGAVGGLTFWLLARNRLREQTEATAHDPHS